MRILITLIILLISVQTYAWKNGPDGNAQTNKASECANPPYSTHDWVADRALAMLPANEQAWLLPHKNLYLLGTEAPDNDGIHPSCNTAHRGYDDRRKGHSVEWKANWSGMKKDRAAVRASQEYDKAVVAYQAGEPGEAAFYLGAMAHYIGDVSQYGHAVPFETKQQHGGYEGWAGRRTKEFASPEFDKYMRYNGPTIRTPYTAAKRVSKATAGGRGDILSASQMIWHWENGRGETFVKSAGLSLNLGVNELADVLHRFYEKQVSK